MFSKVFNYLRDKLQLEMTKQIIKKGQNNFFLIILKKIERIHHIFTFARIIRAIMINSQHQIFYIALRSRAGSNLSQPHHCYVRHCIN